MFTERAPPTPRAHIITECRYSLRAAAVVVGKKFHTETQAHSR